MSDPSQYACPVDQCQAIIYCGSAPGGNVVLGLVGHGFEQVIEGFSLSQAGEPVL